MLLQLCKQETIGKEQVISDTIDMVATKLMEKMLHDDSADIRTASLREGLDFSKDPGNKLSVALFDTAVRAQQSQTGALHLDSSFDTNMVFEFAGHEHKERYFEQPVADELEQLRFDFQQRVASGRGDITDDNDIIEGKRILEKNNVKMRVVNLWIVVEPRQQTLVCCRDPKGLLEYVKVNNAVKPSVNSEKRKVEELDNYLDCKAIPTSKPGDLAVFASAYGQKNGIMHGAATLVGMEDVGGMGLSREFRFLVTEKMAEI